MRYLLAIALTLVGCGSTGTPTPEPAAGGLHSGLDPSAEVATLDEGQRTQLCQWWADSLGGAGFTKACESCDGDACEDWTVTVTGLDECLSELTSYAGCGITVDEVESCASAQAPDVCGETGAACEPLIGC